jgi:hypothetical protein
MPRRRTTLQFSQIRLTLARTFMTNYISTCIKGAKHPSISVGVPPCQGLTTKNSGPGRPRPRNCLITYPSCPVLRHIAELYFLILLKAPGLTGIVASRISNQHGQPSTFESKQPNRPIPATPTERPNRQPGVRTANRPSPPCPGRRLARGDQTP